MSNSEVLRSDRIRQIITLILVLGASVAANILGASMGGVDTGDVANQTFGGNVYFFPATYVFATIWPVIYLGIMVLAVFQALPAQATNPRYRSAGYILSANLILNATWIVIFGLELFWLSLITIIPILVTGIISYLRLRGSQEDGSPFTERVLRIPVAMYAAWLTIATVANASAALASADWNGWGISYPIWGVIMLVVGIGLGCLLWFRFRDPVFSFVYAYAYLGIVVRRIGEVQNVTITAAIGAGVFAVLTVLGLFLFRKGPQEAT